MQSSSDSQPVGTETDTMTLSPEGGQFLPYLATLASADIPHWAEQLPDGRWVIVVPAEAADQARRELDAYEESSRNWQVARSRGDAVRHAGPGAVLSTAAVVFGLLLFYGRTGPAQMGSRFFDVGALDVASTADGAWWRTLTSLTLHADGTHVLGNAVCAGVFGMALCQLVAAGPAWFIVLASGVLGNASEVLVSEAGRTAVGASTATFGALGALGALQTVRHRRRWPGFVVVFSKTWVPLSAAAVFLGIFGSGPRADILGHLFGFAWGAVLGAVCWPLLDRDLPWYWHGLIGALCAAALATAWRTALLQSG